MRRIWTARKGHEGWPDLEAEAETLTENGRVERYYVWPRGAERPKQPWKWQAKTLREFYLPEDEDE